MKVKRFDNLWTMGLIICGAMLIIFYALKIIFPQFIVGVAEMPSIVKFGTFVDSHLWAYILFSSCTSYLLGYFYFCACCRTYKLDFGGNLIFICSIVALRVLSMAIPAYYTAFNYISMILVPFLICKLNSKLYSKTFTSTVFCFCADLITQILSVEIRDITSMVSQINSSTFMILSIDVLIWRTLLYFYFNNKKEAN